MAPPELGRDQLRLLQRLCFGDDAFDEDADRAFAEEDEDVDEDGLYHRVAPSRRPSTAWSTVDRGTRMMEVSYQL